MARPEEAHKNQMFFAFLLTCLSTLRKQSENDLVNLSFEVIHGLHAVTFLLHYLQKYGKPFYFHIVTCFMFVT